MPPNIPPPMRRQAVVIVCLEDGGTYTESSVPGSYMPIQRIEVCTIGQDA